MSSIGPQMKIQYLIHNMTNNSGMKTNNLIHQHRKSFTNHMNKSMDYNGIKNYQGNTSILPHMSSLQNIQSGVEYYYSNSHDKLHEEQNKSTQRLPTHNKKNVSFSINNSHHPKTLSMKLSKPKLRLQNESIPIPTSKDTQQQQQQQQQRISTIVSNQNNNQDTDDECIDDTIKLQNERMIREYNNNNRYYNYNIINEPIQEEIAH
eukprot:413522_1